MLEGAEKKGTATWREQLTTDGPGRYGEQCERAAEYWFINPGMSMQCACREHMWRRLESARVHRVAIPFGKLKAGEKERCGQINRGGQRPETKVEGYTARGLRNDDLDSDKRRRQYSDLESAKRVKSATSRRREKKLRKDKQISKRRKCRQRWLK